MSSAVFACWQPLERLPAHLRLQQSAKRWLRADLRTEFAAHPNRTRQLTWRLGPWLIDLSKHLWDEAVVAQLLELASGCALPAGTAALFGGERVNFTEDRPALHMACRGGAQPPAGDANRFHEAETSFARLVARYRSNQWLGATGQPLTAIVNLGIGGSDVGPRLVAEAFRVLDLPMQGTLRFVANLDPRDFRLATADLNPATTLFVVTSKSFSTAETLSNSMLARHWLAQGLGLTSDDPRLSAHFLAVTSRPEKAAAIGYSPDQTLWLPEWVGGRYSLWSTVGFPLAAAYGWEAFAQLRAGARAVDDHFRTAPLAENVPVLLGLLGVWLSTYLELPQMAVLPYAEGLRLLPAWLQQLEMESNGKRIRRDGSPAPYATGASVWGMIGTLGQHAFHQWFYQGTRRIPLEFIAFAPTPPEEASALTRQQQQAAWALAANAIAQAEALLVGRSREAAHTQLLAQGSDAALAEQLAPHLEIPGNVPSTFLLADRDDPQTLGMLLALYEHATFVRGWLWGINPFDQYGVELGKQMAQQLAAPGTSEHDPSTVQLLARLGLPPSA